MRLVILKLSIQKKNLAFHLLIEDKDHQCLIVQIPVQLNHDNYYSIIEI